jgi:hypothetical protein
VATVAIAFLVVGLLFTVGLWLVIRSETTDNPVLDRDSAEQAARADTRESAERSARRDTDEWGSDRRT